MTRLTLAQTQDNALASIAFTRGRRDRLNGFSPAANPYPTGSVESEQYRQGRLSVEDQINDYADAKPRTDFWANDSRYDMPLGRYK